MRLLPLPLGRSFNALWFGTGASNLGDGMALFVLPLLALATGASPGGVAAVTAALTLAWPVFGIHAGWIVDRVDRRLLLAGVNAVRALTLAGLTAGLLTGTLSLPLLLVAAVLIGVAETLVDTALTSTIPLVVEPVGRNRANARVEATINVTNQLAGPPLAGLLAGITLAVATGASAALYVLAVAGVAFLSLNRAPAGPGRTDGIVQLHTCETGDVVQLHTRETGDVVQHRGHETGGVVQFATPARPEGNGGTVQRPAPARPRENGGVVAGLRYLWRQPVVRTLTLITAAMNIPWAVSTALLVVHAVSPGPLGLTTAQYGLVLTAMAVGGLIASAVVEPLRRRFGVTTLLIADAAGTVLLVAPVALGGPVWTVVAGAVVAGAGSSIWRVLVATIRQNLSPPELLGRVYSASRVISWGVIPFSAALAGLGAELWGVRTVFVIATVLAAIILAAFVPYALRTDLSAAVAPEEDRRPVA